MTQTSPPVSQRKAVSLSIEQAIAQVRATVRRSGTSFFWAMRRLEPHRRDAMFALYAYCRVVDDIVDEPGEPACKRAQLEDWRAEIARVFNGQPNTAVGLALRGPVKEFALVQADFLAIIDGMLSDTPARVRLEDEAALVLYMDRVACAVGRLSNRIFGIEENADTALSKALGEALQLTNILRDIDEDAARDRLYIPSDLLRVHGIESDDAQDIVRHSALPDICQALARRARDRFDQARVLLGQCERRTARPAVMMMAIYERLLHKLCDAGWDAPRRVVTLSRPEKLWVVLRHGIV